ncbi:MAG: class II aldolase/adducin family protein [Christensenellales bacterium]|jgi:L-fuculose-phosphate aldolase
MAKYLSEFEAKQMICEYGRRLYQQGFVVANDGNITVKVGDNEIWATPTFVSKGFMNPDMLLKMDLDGNVLNSCDYKPTSELKMHLGIMKANPETQAVVHAHPTAATSLSVVGKDIEDADIIIEPILALGDYIPCCPFGMPGTYEIPEALAPYAKTHAAALLSNHGAVTWGNDLKMAYYRMELLEHFCKVYINATYVIGQKTSIPKDQIEKMIAKRGW